MKYEKRGAQILWLCDTRIAVCIVNAIALALLAPNVLYGIQEGFSIKNVILLSFGAAFAIGGIIGAIMYNQVLLGANVIYVLTELVVVTVYFVQEFRDTSDDDLVDEDESMLQQWKPYIDFGVAGFIFLIMIYPHICLMFEINRGIMRRETYHVERYCCPISTCCGCCC